MARHVGDDPEVVAENRNQLSRIAGNVQFMNQVHGDSFLVVDKLEAVDPTCDALITTTPGLALAVLVADCVPLLLSSSNVVAAVHVGRKGLMSSLVLSVVQQMRILGADSIHAQLGPSICGRCYEVPTDMADEVLNLHPSAFALNREGNPALDLPRALITELVGAGISYEASGICTLEDQLYFSYRRHNITGRNAGVIWL